VGFGHRKTLVGVTPVPKRSDSGVTMMQPAKDRIRDNVSKCISRDSI
jgi:hypothetical protein